MSEEKARPLREFRYLYGYHGERGAERIYKTDDGLYMCIETPRYKNGKWGKGTKYYTRTPNVRSSWKKEQNEKAE